MRAQASDVTAAILLWLPEGVRPKSGDFRDNPSAEVLPSFADAVKRAMAARFGSAESLPWVKIGSRIFDPEQLRSACGTLHDIKGRTQNPA